MRYLRVNVVEKCPYAALCSGHDRDRTSCPMADVANGAPGEAFVCLADLNAPDIRHDSRGGTHDVD